MKRKQIYISEEIEEAVKELAACQSVPEAVIIREALQQYITKSSDKNSKKKNPLYKLIGLVKGGPKDGSKNLDHYLYHSVIPSR